MRNIFNVFTVMILFAISFTSCQSDAEKRAEAEAKKIVQEAQLSMNEIAPLPSTKNVGNYEAWAINFAPEADYLNPNEVYIKAKIESPIINPDKVCVTYDGDNEWVKFSHYVADDFNNENYFDDVVNVNKALLKGATVTAHLSPKGDHYEIYSIGIDYPVVREKQKSKRSNVKIATTKAEPGPQCPTCQVINNTTTNYYNTTIEKPQCKSVAEESMYSAVQVAGLIFPK